MLNYYFIIYLIQREILKWYNDNYKGYPCCTKTTEVVSEDSDGQWGKWLIYLLIL